MTMNFVIAHERVCSTCKHCPSDEYCEGCTFDWRDARGNTHWEPREPFINKPCISEQACHEDKMKVLEKIRAEIAAIDINGRVDEHTLFIRTGEQVKQMALDIVYKYTAESEDKE